MAENSIPDIDKKEKFYNEVRKRTANAWRKQYVTTRDEEEEAKKVLERLRTKPDPIYSVNVSYISDYLLHEVTAKTGELVELL